MYYYFWMIPGWRMWVIFKWQKLYLMVLLRICLVFCQFQLCVTDKSVAPKIKVRIELLWPQGFFFEPKFFVVREFVPNLVILKELSLFSYISHRKMLTFWIMSGKKICYYSYYSCTNGIFFGQIVWYNETVSCELLIRCKKSTTSF